MLIEQVTYKLDEAETGGLQPDRDGSEPGGQLHVAGAFINALERDEMFFIIDSVTLGGEPQGPVKLSMKLETYLKAGT